MKKNQLLVELTDSEDEPEQPGQIVAPCSPRTKGPIARKSSSGIFEIIDEAEFTSEFTETSRGGILLQKSQHKSAVLSVLDWEHYFNAKEGVSIIMFADAMHSVVVGLDDQRTLLLWNGACEQSLMEPHTRSKQPNPAYKYQTEIQQALAKLEKNYLGIGYTSQEMKSILPEVLTLLNQYSLEDPEVGFSRGMEYLAFGIVQIAMSHPAVQTRMLAHKLSYLEHIMRKLQFRGMYLPSKPVIFSKTKRLEARLEKQHPALMKIITECNLDCSHVFYKYYLSLFLYANTHRVLVSRLLELLLLQGEDFITFLLLRIIAETEEHLLQLPHYKLEQYLRNELFRGYFSDVGREEALRLLEGLVIKRMDCAG